MGPRVSISWVLGLQVYPHAASYVGSKDQSQAVTPAQHALSWLNHLPRPAH